MTPGAPKHNPPWPSEQGTQGVSHVWAARACWQWHFRSSGGGGAVFPRLAVCSCGMGISPSSSIGTSKLEREFQHSSHQHQEEQGKMKLQKWFLPAPFSWREPQQILASLADTAKLVSLKLLLLLWVPGQVSLREIPLRVGSWSPVALWLSWV